jgi:hypothetical protein
MNVAGIIEKLRSELQEIEDAIRSLERFQSLTKAVTEIRSVAKPSDASWGLAVSRRTGRNVLCSGRGAFAPLNSFISYPMLRGHVHRAPRFL